MSITKPNQEGLMVDEYAPNYGYDGWDEDPEDEDDLDEVEVEYDYDEEDE